jgi:hypothetical protein
MMQQSTQVRKDTEFLSTPQRWAGLYTVVLMLLLLAFFIYHQRTNSGLFTNKFGWLQMIALYGPILISLAPPFQRLIQGRRNPARPLEAVTDLSLALGSAILLASFPFDFSHLADPFPATMRFAFAWINNNIGRLILILQLIIGILSALSTMYSYLKVKGKIRSRFESGS